MPAYTHIDPDIAETWLHVPGDWRRPHVKEDYTILWDSARSYGQIWPRPSPREVLAYYQTEEYYTHGVAKGSTELHTRPDQRLMTKLSWLADRGLEPDQAWWRHVLGGVRLRILEIGCGNGSNLSLLRSLGHEVIGVEPDTQALEIARKEGHQVHEGTAELLPVEVSNDRFDAVIFMHVLEHCIDPFQAVQSVVRILNSDGLVVAEVPNNECIGRKRFGLLWHWLDVPRHLNFFTSKSLVDLFRFAGLKIDSISYCGYCRQFSPSWITAQCEIAKAFGMPKDNRIKDRNYWVYLLETAWANRARKFDSVRIVGRLARDKITEDHVLL